MPGVRIQHPTKRNVLFSLVDGSRPYHVLTGCDACHRVHEFKTYHFALDESGAAIVSPEIVERLKRIPGQPFAVANVVTAPPVQVVRVPGLRILTRPIAPGV